MRAKRLLRRALYRMLQGTHVLPSVWMLGNPFKIWEYQAVMAGVSLEPYHEVLDLGCGRGFQTQVLARKCRRVVGLDISPAQIAGAREFLRGSPVERRVEFVCSRLEDAGFPDARFDRILSFCVLEHIPNLNVVLAEIARILKPRGELHVSVDALATIRDPLLIEKHRAEHHVVQYFTPHSLEQQLRGAGLDVMEIAPLLTGEFARRQFEKRILAGRYGCPMHRKVGFVHRLAVEDQKRCEGDGIMLIGRARRPT
ncbi:MAG: class I SAM-dependent methyltransferase [Chthonomonadales bacterium]